MFLSTKRLMDDMVSSLLWQDQCRPKWDHLQPILQALKDWAREKTARIEAKNEDDCVIMSIGRFSTVA